MIWLYLAGIVLTLALVAVAMSPLIIEREAWAARQAPRHRAREGRSPWPGIGKRLRSAWRVAAIVKAER